MKKITITLLICILSLCAGAQNCRTFKKDSWYIVYNKYYKKYAVARHDGDGFSFLVRDHDGEYGVYAEGWEDLYCVECGDTSLSLFDTPCEAKQYLLNYYLEEKKNNWQ